MKRVHRRQATTIPAIPSGFSSGLSVSTSSVQTTVLIANASATPADDSSGQTISSIPTTSATSSSTSATSSGSSDSIPLSAVIGICVGVFVGLSVIILLVFCIFRQRARKEKQAARVDGSQRRNSGRWVKMNDGDGDAVYEKYSMKARPAPGNSPTTLGGTTIERSITVKSAKSTKTFKTGLGFSEAFKTPEVPPQLEFTDGDLGSGRVHTEGFDTLPPLSTTFARVNAPPISWDGETVRADSGQYADYHIATGSVDSPMSSMVGCFQTPPAVETKMHQWEQAEVVSPDEENDAYGGVESNAKNPFATSHSNHGDPTYSQTQSDLRSSDVNHHKNPFDDNSSVPRTVITPVSLTARSNSSDSASFFSTQTDLTVRHGAFDAVQRIQTQTVEHERSESTEHAMASLIAALNISPEEARERLSAAILPTPRASAASGLSIGTPSVLTNESNNTESGALDEAGFRRFPLPPTDIEHHSS